MRAAQINKNYTNKEGFKTLLWCIAGALAIMFSVQLVKVVKGFFAMLTGKKGEEELQKKADEQTNEVQALIKTSGYSPSTLPKPIAHYATIANSCEQYMQGWGTKSKEMYDLLKGLTANELKAVYLKFGSRINRDFSNDTGTLFTWFDWELTDYNPLDIGVLTRMRLLWKQTLLPITF